MTAFTHAYESSFGSVLYAPTEEQIGILLDVLDELDMRYIMAEGNAPSEIKDMMRARIGTGKSQGLLVAWAPQRAILSHPVRLIPFILLQNLTMK